MLNFSIFDVDDGTLSGARDYDPSGALLRDVELRIDGRFQSNLSGWFSDNRNAAGIQAWLEGRGWIIERVANESTAWFPQQSAFNYRIFAIVATHYSDRTIQDQLRRDLSGFFNVTGISTVSPPWAGQVGTVTIDGRDRTPANYQAQTPPAATPPPGAAGSGFLDDFAKGLGISTPIALVGAGLLVVLLLRR